ncbi:Pathogenesis-related protein 5 [Cyphellophora attinorum]|uniref:Pathogenesis-related protein 5 n=1 Tax=Cyphellophora attinorum TaxID=1664694 RepID=A0A0N1NZI4_9EURO|nr:Pathogenesis-related protein 5 [Phialophora attinorum]KPI37415.1 Pathogenesis-related protein 5 [Phialophora attinorum]
MSSASQQTFYDISMVDGYNLPMGIKLLASESSNRNISDIPPNLTNPVCIGSTALLEPIGSTSDALFSTNATYPIPLEQSLSSSFVSSWCPFPLLAFPPEKPGDGVYPYPDDNIHRPLFSPCFSACAKWNLDRYCCAGNHDSPGTCKRSYYSTQAKKVCPDAYSFAYDDKKSTFIVPEGGGYEVVFCPRGRSSNILATLGPEMQVVAQTGQVTRDVEDKASDADYIAKRNDAGKGLAAERLPSDSLIALAVLLGWICLSW